MLSKRFSHLIRLFAIISLSYFVAGCGDGDGPKPIPGEPCQGESSVAFDADSYPENANFARILVTDTCIALKTVTVSVYTGTDNKIVLDVDIVDGAGTSAVNFGDTGDASNTIAIKEGDVLTATYSDANSVTRTGTADITEPTATLGVYSETNINPLLTFAEITINDTVTDRFGQTVSALEGDYSLQADFSLPASGDENGFAFTFFGLINATFEANDASDGNFPCNLDTSLNLCTGWTAFEFAFTNNTAGPGFGPVSHDALGSQSLTMFGPFTFDSSTGAYQSDNNVVPGESYTATAHVMNWAPDPIAAGNLGIFQLTFWDAAGGQDGGGSQIGPAFELLVDSTDDNDRIYLPPQDGAEISDWTELTITQDAPAGAVSAEIFLLHIQLNPASDPDAQAGSIFWDDVSLNGVKDLSTAGEDISTYGTLQFGINTTEASEWKDLEVKMEDNTGVTASVFLSNYEPLSTDGWAVYTIPLTDFTGLDKTRMISLGFHNASSTVTGSTAVAPTLLAATLHFDDVHFVKAVAAPVLTGVLLDSPVEGVTFQTATQSGITNAAGEFQYLDGETITFSVGGIVLGTVVGAPVITPVELTGSADPTIQDATNQLVFLQSIDEDENPLNGITISAASQAAAVSQSLDFTLDSAAFTSAATSVVAVIAPANTLVSETTALDNFYQTYVNLGGTDTFNWLFPGYPPVPAEISGSNTTIDAAPASVVADGLTSSTITVQAKDTSGNDFTETAGVVLLEATGSAILSPVIDNDDGTYTATMTNTVAEAVTVSGSIAGNLITDDAIVTFTVDNSPETLGVYSETNTNPVLAYSQIIDAADLGGNATIPDEFSTAVTAYEGSVSLEADFQDDGANASGITFDFTGGASSGPNLLSNGGFGSPEASGGDVLCHTDWDCVNGSYTTAADGPAFAPVSHNPEDNQSIKQFGNDGLTFQVVAATPGTTYQASVWAMNWTGNGTTDPFTEFAFVELSFLDAGGATLPGSQYVYVDAVDDGTNVYLPPQDGAEVSDWTELSLSAVAPAGTASVKMLLIHQLVGGSGGTIRWDDASINPDVVTPPVVSELLSNGGFGSPEASGGDVLCHTDWDCVNGSYTTAADGPAFAPVSHNPEDNQSIKQFGNDGLTFQVVAATPGTTYQASVWAMNWTGNGTTDPFTEFAFVELSFLDAGGATLPGSQYVYVDAVDDGTNVYLPPQDGAEVSDWTELSLSAVAPAGTASVKMLLIHQLAGGSGGTIRWDDASITAETSPASGGDISEYETLKFAIDNSNMPAFAELVIQLEDSTVSSALNLTDYVSMPNQGPGGNWEVYEIPVSDFVAANSQLDLTKIANLGLLDAQDASGLLTFGQLYFDDIHFIKGTPTVPVLTGVLLDSPVEGVTFQTATQSGITNAAGEFQYLDGETITFSVGGIVLGTVTGAPLISPVELSGAVSSIDQVAINLMVFLQSIDEDQDLFNGINITQSTRDAAATQTLDFTLDSAEFTSAVAPVVTAITSVNPDGPNTVVSETTALDNFYVTYVFGGGTDTFSWSFPPQYPAYPGTDACLPVDFEAGGCPYFIGDFYGVETTVIDNPDTTANSSAKVAQVQKFANSPETFGGSLFVLGTVDFSIGEVFTMKVWASRPVPVTFKLEGLDQERVVSHSGSGAWEELTFDFTGFTSGSDVTQVTVFFDLDNAGDAAGNPDDWTFYIDDIALTDSSSVPKDYQLIWSDEFDVDGVPDPDNWTIETGYGPDNDGWGNQEWQLYTTSPDNIRVESDNLVITADCSEASVAPENCGVRDGTITSGKIISEDKFSFRYGKVEAKIKLPVGQGAWSAFWMLGENFSDVGWPRTGEIDIVEMFQTNNGDPQTTHFTIHYFDDTGNVDPSCLTTAVTGHIYCTDKLRLTESLGEDYHIFSAEWDATGITGKIDGVPYFYKAIDPGTMDEFLKEFFLILNVAMGGNLGGDVTVSTPWPQVMLVDYVRVYQDVDNSESTFTIGGGAPPDPLGVYSETNTDPALAYGIVNVANLGGKDIVIDENSVDTVLEGSFSFKAEYKSTGTGLNYNGFIFDFTSAVGGANLLSNGGFGSPEASGGDVLCHTDWDCVNGSYTTAADGPAFAPVSHNPEDNQSIKQFGNDGLTFQVVAATPGTTYQASVWAMNWTGNGTTDPFTEFAFVELSFLDAGGATLPGSQYVYVDAVDDGTNVYLPPQDGAEVSDWTELSLSAVAPAGTASVKMLLIHQLVGGSGGTIRWDDASISAGAAPATPEVDISGYEVLKFGLNIASASGLMDLEIKMEDASSATASVFLSAYASTPSGVSGWDLYEIPLSDFAGIDQTRIASLGYWSASSTETGSTAVEPMLLDAPLYFDDVHFDQANAVGGGMNLLLNSGFGSPEASGGDVLCHTDWGCVNGSYTTAADGPAFAPVSHNPEDNQSIKQFGNDGLTFQVVAATPGTTYQASVWAMNWTGNGTTDPFTEFAFVELSFLDAGGATLPGSQYVYVDAVDDGTNVYLPPQDGAEVSDWTELSLSAVAPAGTASVKMLLIHQLIGGSGGTIRWDDASISASP